MSTLALYLFGAPRIELNHEAVQLGRRKALALLAYLAVGATGPAGRAYSRDALATLLWPEHGQARARANLRDVLSTLNRELGLEWLAAERETVALNFEGDPAASSRSVVWLDVTTFRQRLAGCEEHDPSPESACPTCVSQLEEAVALYADDFMAGFSLRDSLAFDEWQLFQAETLRRELAFALERLVRGLSLQEEYEPAIIRALRWVGLDPLHEPAQRALITLYARAGQAAAAIRQYDLYEQILAQELGIRPSEDTRVLLERIRTSAETPREGRTFSTIPHNLPPQPNPFVGREEDLARLAKRLADPACRLLTLVGPGGIGKTRLTLQATQDLVDGAYGPALFPHGVFFVSLASVDELDSVVPTIATALGFRFHGEGDPRQQLLSYLREKELLLVLDSFEHLLKPGVGVEGEGGRELVAAILHVAPAVTLLVTSREALNLQAEWFHPVDGLRYPGGDVAHDEQATARLEDFGAVVLFEQCARRARPGFSLAEEKRWVMRICQLVEGMPLAIEMAAGWLRAMPASRLAEEIERDLDLLTTSLTDVPERHRSIRAVFDHSWHLLTEREQEVARRLSVFRGAFSSKAAQSVTGAGLTVLVELVDRSLLQTTPDGRYEMHALLRQFAAEKLRLYSWQEEATRDRHALHFTAFLKERGEALKGSQQQSALAEIEAEVENARAAWDWAVKRGHVEWLAKAIDGLCLFYEWRGRLPEGDTTCARAAERLAAATSTDELRLLSRVLTWRAVFVKWLAKTEQARRLVERGHNILDRPALADHDVRPERAFALQIMSDFPVHKEGIQRLRESSLQLCQQLGDRWREAALLYRLGYASRHMGAYDDAQRRLEESLGICRQLGDHRGVAYALHGMASIAIRQGRLEEAEPMVREGIKIRQGLGDRYGSAMGLGLLGSIHATRGEYAQARAFFEDSRAILGDLGVRGAYAWWGIWLGWAEAHLGRYAEARAEGHAAATFYRDADFVGGGQVSLYLLGCVALVLGTHAEAEGLLQECVTVCRGRGVRDIFAEPLVWLGYVRGRLGKRHEAREHLAEALRTGLETGGSASLPEYLAAVGAFLASEQLDAEGDAAFEHKLTAVELYALASTAPSVSNSCWFRDAAGQHIAAAAATLPPQVVAAAKERGCARDLWETAEELLAELADSETRV